MKQPHKHAALIKAWADGAEIEAYQGSGVWNYLPSPSWNIGTTYRIKPEPKPDYEHYCIIAGGCIMTVSKDCAEREQTYKVIRITMDGETNQPKKAEVL